jgi:hypothetical protein
MFQVSFLVLSTLVAQPPVAPILPMAPVLVAEEPPGEGFDPAKSIQACESGGPGANICSIGCHKVFNFYTTQCSVSCRSGYYACCSCDDGCDCIIDHDELWPLPPGVDPWVLR